MQNLGAMNENTDNNNLQKFCLQTKVKDKWHNQTMSRLSLKTWWWLLISLK